MAHDPEEIVALGDRAVGPRPLGQEMEIGLLALQREQASERTAALGAFAIERDVGGGAIALEPFVLARPPRRQRRRRLCRRWMLRVGILARAIEESVRVRPRALDDAVGLVLPRRTLLGNRPIDALALRAKALVRSLPAERPCLVLRGHA